MTDHLLGHKSILENLRNEIISSIFSENTMRSEINYRKKLKKKNTWRLDNMLQITKRSMKKSKRKLKK